MARKTHPKKFVFITGGVVSSLGKGIAASGLGALMEARGLRVSFLKLDPYVNVDPGTMNPTQHGEVFVTDDGAETDLDLGHYERFTTARMSRKNNYTSGQIYYSVIMKERRGEYLGGTVQVIPHITDEIKTCITAAAAECDVLFTEIGGTVGDIESLPFLEAIRQMRTDVGDEHICYIHVTLVPYIAAAGEVKTKPTQHSVRELRAIGIQPDMLVCRSDRPIGADIKGKIAKFCNVDVSNVIGLPDVETIYEVPLGLHSESADQRVLDKLNMWTGAPRLDGWERLVDAIRHPRREAKIAIVGKYVDLTDSYKSLNEALRHAGYAHGARVSLQFVDSEQIEREGAETLLSGADAILVPGGFGRRGSEGKIAAVRYAREKRVPFFGICLGLQMAAVEFARNVAGIADAHSREFVPDAVDAVIDLMPDQEDVVDKGGTMRLGAYPCVLDRGSRVAQIYAATEVSERHRHRYEFANRFREPLEAAGLRFSGKSPDGRLVEMIELSDHPWFVGCQFHPEFKSRPTAPHPLFRSFIEAALEAQADDEAAQ
ncbi:MAG: CTP synthase [Myxococcales bacterium]|nr:CTP synthase [Myxococcales bacterium]MCB9530970.1 CTP synthase [Myxococcales bacterium]MCB9532890.1 CTP synthase [Myxococcales bacterium]